ncbi:TLC domain-containing protein [Blastocladiella britannica]|nr:TLC domain-containing protein [Blastocladiella britannica]
MPLAFLSAVALASYLLPASPVPFSAFLTPSHPVAPSVAAQANTTWPVASQYYAKGPLDFLFVAGGVLAWTLARALVIDYFLKPVGKALGCRKSMIDRFSEQGWLVIYYTLSWGAGMYFAMGAPWWKDTVHFWTDAPHLYLSASFKAYYLAQCAFWIQQLFVIHIEKPRKDHLQMLVHHIVTIALIVSSYYTNYTRIGCAVLATMDVGDIFLCSAKCFNYVHWRTICDATFVLFVGVWLYSRHYIYYFLIRSVYVESLATLEMRWAPSEGRYVSIGMWYFFLALLIILQILLVLWLYLILRVIAKVITGSGAEDNRSDDEEDDDHADEAVAEDGPVKTTARADGGAAETTATRRKRA